MALPWILTLGCAVTIGGVVVAADQLQTDELPAQTVLAYPVDAEETTVDPFDNAVFTPGRHIEAEGSPLDSTEYGVRRWREIAATAVWGGQRLQQRAEHTRPPHRTPTRPATAASGYSSRGSIFQRSRRGQQLDQLQSNPNYRRQLGRRYSPLANFRSASRGNLNPVGTKSIFERSRSFGRHGSVYPAINANNRIRTTRNRR